MMLESNWLLAAIPLLPLLGFLINIFFVKRERDAGYIASGAVLLAFVVALIAFVQLASLPAEERRMQVVLWEWINTGDFRIPFGLLFDPLSAVMTLLVTGVGGLIHVYSIGYIHGDVRPVRYFAYLNLFVTMMLLLVLGNNMLLLFLGWEGVGLCSFLLIGHWFDRRSVPPGINPAGAAVKAFVVNRIGDAAFLLAMMAIFAHFGTLTFYEVAVNNGVIEGFLEHANEINGLTFSIPGQSFLVATGISFLLLIGVTGKSAQIPLFVWLPDAMAGPTPVSALIHAATMVTAGVYLMARTHSIFELSSATMGWVAWIGALTAFLAATAAITQWDIKRVLAYSTVSQLGYMVAAAGMGVYAAALFHLLTHGIFKALLFLGSGSVIHGAHENQDMRKMGGLREHMPWTFWTYMIGALALAGIFPLAGFWSKDEIVAYAWTNQQTPIFILLLLSSLLTAFYMGRQVALIFYGQQRDTSYQAHESGRVMTVPLIILGVGSIIAGAMNLPGDYTGAHLLTSWLKPVLEEEAAKFGFTEFTLAVIATLGAVGMAYLGWRFYTNNAAKIKAGGKDPLYHYSGDIWDAMEEAWYFDRIYERYTVVPGFKRLANFMARIFDPEGIDGLVKGVGWTFTQLASGLRAIQSGYVRTYALLFLIGVVAVLGYLVMIG
ncbi:MAG: NADH-quinone oxidoreductase subunit L [Chloroflexales bacterium]|nr:NADH-quinone oxidoreductase subunit L [Chloroflexales bacterium]